MAGGTRVAIGTVSLWLAALSAAGAATQPCFSGVSWTQADALFRNDAAWIGADGASSVDLGNGKTLWLFADSWIDPTRKRTRRGATLIRNSIAIQRGRDPSNASIEFFWRSDANGKPTAFIAGTEEEWFWPGHGVRVGDSVLVFLNRLRRVSEGLGFASAGWNAVLIHNPDDEPPDWRMQMVATPQNNLGITPGFAGVIQWRGFVYVLGTADPDKTHPVFVVRWPSDAVSRGELLEPAWWTGTTTGWQSGAAASAVPVFGDGQSELGIVRDPVQNLFLVAQTTGFGAADIALRSSAEIGGPWTASRTVFRPPEFNRPNIMIYAAKLHPQLDGADLVLTYATNTAEFGEHFSDASIYYPRFIRLSRCRGSTGNAGEDSAPR